MRKPSWDCFNEADKQRLERWTVEQLEPPGLRDLPDDQYWEMRMQLDPSFAASTEEHFGRRLRRGRVIEAIEDLDRLIGSDPELRKLALDRLRPRGRGRRKGERRPGDWTADERRRLEAALGDVGRIRRLWKAELGKQNRTEEPTAVQIAARMHGFEEIDLVAFQSNKNKSSS
jgi:hypothetical protein